MIYSVRSITTLLLLFAVSASAEAQLFDRLKNKAKEAAERKLEEKASEQLQKAAEDMVERSWNSIFGELPENSKRSPFKLNSDVVTEDTYEFDTITTMEIETVKKNGKSEPPAEMEIHYNSNSMYSGIKFSGEQMEENEGDLFIIYDFKNAAMLMLMENEEDKFAFAYDWKQALKDSTALEDSTTDNPQKQENTDPEEVNWEEVEEWRGYKKIGQKEIAGYSCDGYRSENESGLTEIWVTREVDPTMTNIFGANTNIKQIKGRVPDQYPYGTLMEMTSEDFESGDKTIMKVTEVNKNVRVAYAMDEYPIMSFGLKNGDEDQK